MEFILALGAIFIALILPIIAMVAFARTSRLQRQVAALEATLKKIAPAQLGVAGTNGEADEAPYVPPAMAEVADNDASEPVEEPAAEPGSQDAAMALANEGIAASETVSQDADLESSSPEASGPPDSDPPIPVVDEASNDNEPREVNTSKWLVWAGGLALALGGIFLVRYAISVGVLTPIVRVLMGLVAGAAMIGVGELMRRRSFKVPDVVAETITAIDRIPAILCGAGLITLFGSIFSADTFYDLISPLVAFVLLAIISLAGTALALLHGPALGVLGLIGALVVPILIESEAPSPWSLFGYLAFVIGIMSTVSFYRGWAWLGWAALVGGAGWLLSWLVFAPSGDPHPIGLYLVFLAALPLWQPAHKAATLWRATLRDIIHAPLFIWSGVVSALAVMTMLAQSFGTVSILAMAGIAAIYVAAAWKAPVRLSLACVSALAVLVAHGLWQVPANVVAVYTPGLDIYGGPPLAAPAFKTFVISAIGFGALYFASGFAALGRVRFSGTWVSLSAAVPVSLLFLAYWRWADFDTSNSWAGAAIALAGLNVFAASRMKDVRVPLGPYATATIACLSLALTMILREAWLSVALSLQLPFIAMIALRQGLPVLRYVIAIGAAIAMSRLLLNPYLLSYPLGDGGLLPWFIYGYGIPAAAFWFTARTLQPHKDDWVIHLLEAGAIAFVTCLVSFQIRHSFAGTIDAKYDDLWEVALHSAVWLAISYGIYASGALSSRPALKWGAIILRIAGAAQIVFIHGIILNPLLLPVNIGNWPLLNAAGLAYLVPAIFAVFFVRAARARGDHPTMMVAGAFAVGLMFAYLSVEVMRAFRGAVPFFGSPSEAEHYTYSVVWLLYAIALIGIGMWRKTRLLRQVALGVLLLTTLKVFLFDMNSLTGGLRAVSFLGLGVVLIAIGYVFQRYIQPQDRREAAEKRANEKASLDKQTGAPPTSNEA